MFASKYLARGYAVVAVAKLTKFTTYDRVPLMHRDMCLVGMAVFSSRRHFYRCDKVLSACRHTRNHRRTRAKDVQAAVRTGFASGASDVIMARLTRRWGRISERQLLTARKYCWIQRI